VYELLFISRYFQFGVVQQQRHEAGVVAFSPDQIYEGGITHPHEPHGVKARRGDGTHSRAAPNRMCSMVFYSI